MAVIYMRHFIHGSKVAIDELEAQQDEERGWVRYTPGTPDEAAPVNNLEGKRRGRPRKDSMTGVANGIPVFGSPSQ